MPSMPWIKVYTEILDDPKVGHLPDATKWRYIQLLVLAGEYDADGYIVTRDTSVTHADIAWRLRVTPETLTSDIEKLCAAGLIEIDDDAVYIPKFSERQGRAQSEKQAQWRVRQAKKRDKNVTRDTRVSHAPRGEEIREDKDKEEEKSADASAPLAPSTPTVSQTDPAINRVEAATQTPPTTEFHEDSPKPGKVEEPRPRDLLFDAIAEVTQSNVSLLGSRIGKTAAELRKINATPDQVRQVAKWFHAYDWRGKKGEKLTFEILKEVWQPGLKGSAPASPSGGRNRPQVPGYTEQQRQAAAAKSAARNAGRDEQIDGRLAKARQDRANAVNRGDATAVAYFDQMITTLESRQPSERVTA